jgi:hypothetical protein
MREKRHQECGDGPDGEQQGSPPREDAGPEERDTEQQTAEQVADRRHQTGDRQGPDVAGDGTAGEGCEEVVDVLGRLVRQRRQDEHLDEGGRNREHEAGSEQQESDQTQHAGLRHLAEVQPGEPDQEQDGHRHGEEGGEGPGGRGNRCDVLVGVDELDEDEQQPCRDGGDAGRPGECGGGGDDGHDRFARFESPWPDAADDSNLGSEVVTGHPHTM